MPRKPKFIHPVRALRQAVGEAKGHTISQPAFAAMIGTSPATIQSVELGRLRLSPALARRIAIGFSADARSLMKAKGKPRDWMGRIYTADSCRASKVADIPQAAADALGECLLKGVEGLLLAANAPNKKRFQMVTTSLRDWLRSTAKDFQLSNEWDRAMNDLAKRYEGSGKPLPLNLTAWLRSTPG